MNRMFGQIGTYFHFYKWAKLNTVQPKGGLTRLRTQASIPPPQCGSENFFTVPRKTAPNVLAQLSYQVCENNSSSGSLSGLSSVVTVTCPGEAGPRHPGAADSAELVTALFVPFVLSAGKMVDKLLVNIVFNFLTPWITFPIPFNDHKRKAKFSHLIRWVYSVYERFCLNVNSSLRFGWLR